MTVIFQMQVTCNSVERQGFIYQSASGGITPEILAHAIKYVWGPVFPGRSPENVVGSLCDAYAHHWDLEVLDTMKEENFVGIMGVPNATGLWQVADVRNNGILKIKWVQAKRYLLQKKAEDFALPEVQRRVPPGQHDKITHTDVAILLNLVFAPSHCNFSLNRATIAKTGVIPFTKVLLNHPEIRKGAAGVQDSRVAATDAAVAAASAVGGLNNEGLNAKLGPVRALAKLRRERQERRSHGMEIDDDGIAPDALGADAAATLASMDAVKAKGGSFFGAAMLAGDTSGIEFTGDYIRGRAAGLARAHREKEEKAKSDAALRLIAQTTAAGRGAVRGGGKGGRRGVRGGKGSGRVSWAKVCLERDQNHQRDVEALHARIRELEATSVAAPPPPPPMHLLPPPIEIPVRLPPFQTPAAAQLITALGGL
jgi:hypothetical protein